MNEHWLHGRPADDVLFEALRVHLENTVQPRLSGAEAYQNRVALNLLRVLRRGAANAAAAAAAELHRLRDLLGIEGELHSLNTELCRRIRDGSIAIDDARLIDHLDQVALANLSIDSPKYSARAATSVSPDHAKGS